MENKAFSKERQAILDRKLAKGEKLSTDEKLYLFGSELMEMCIKLTVIEYRKANISMKEGRAVPGKGPIKQGWNKIEEFLHDLGSIASHADEIRDELTN